MSAVELKVRGRVQGVGFRPAVWRLANALALSGEVLNDAEGVTVRLQGQGDAIGDFLAQLKAAPPPLARIESIERRDYAIPLAPGFHILDSESGAPRTEIAPDAAVCAECAAEVLDPLARRFRYPFATCTHCGPRLSIVTALPFDRARTAMADFPLCLACTAEYRDPADRRFHAEAMACHACGPRARLIRFDGKVFTFEQHSMLDDVDAACSLLQKGEVLAIKGLGGWQLACDATNETAVRALRERKLRAGKPFALMARDLGVVRRYCELSEEEAQSLAAPEAPILLLKARGAKLPDAVAPGLDTLGFMLPTTPLHLLMLRRMDRPVVMTSGNLSDMPQIIDDGEAAQRLAAVADYALTHDRRIVNRVDDSVARTMGGRLRLIRRARGYAPGALTLPPGFEAAPPVLAFGGELKATFCFAAEGNAVLSQHLGDLENAPTFDDYRRTLALFEALAGQPPVLLAADAHPDYLSSKLARARAHAENLPLMEVQHHHAHVAACLAENGRPLDAPPVLGIVLDGLGWGEGELWGGEFLLADYHSYRRLGTFKPVALPGGAQAMREPWRNLHAHLMAEIGWAEFSMNFSDLPLHADLAARPRALLDQAMARGINAPLASSCGRLFDAVAAALDICREHQSHEGEAASRLEAIVDDHALRHEDESLVYPFTIPRLANGLAYIEPRAMWNALLGDLVLATPAPVIAARFHRGLARVVAAMAAKLAGNGFDTVALSGGCFQNRILFEETERRLAAHGLKVLSHAAVPANDGGLSLGQAAIAAARAIKGEA